MKIEKVNDHQIRCTLTKADLADRELKISELAYGTEKAKSLFRDMMQQANFEFGFEAEDIPLMIEAIPMSSECIVLIITKVEDPDELDTRFSKFAPSVHSDEQDDDDPDATEDLFQDITNSTEEVLDLFRKIQERIGSNPSEDSASTEQNSDSERTSAAPETDAGSGGTARIPLVRLFSFDSLDALIDLSKVVSGIYSGVNSLYKDSRNDNYLLLVYAEHEDATEFNRIANLVSEYGRPEQYTCAVEAYLDEHSKPILLGNALEDLLKLK